MTVFSEMGLRRVINANGKMTILGVSTASDAVAESVKRALQSFVVIEDLIDYAGQVIAKKTGAEGGCPTVGAAAGVAICCAAAIAGNRLSWIERLPHSEGLPNQIIIQKGQVVHFGGSITQMMRLGGGQAVEVGYSNKVEMEHIEGAINEKTAAILYVVSHHAVQKGMQSLEKVLALGARHSIPVIVDAAAEEDLKKYIALGADMVVYSGGKALCGPTSGFICGKKRYTEACKMQYSGIGRAMKVSKESMTGLIAALQAYDGSTNSEHQKQLAQKICEQLSPLSGLSCRIAADEAGRAIYRAEIKVDAIKTGITAEALDKKLKIGNPAIYLRDYYARSGVLLVDTRSLRSGEEDEIIQALSQILKEAQHA